MDYDNFIKLTEEKKFRQLRDMLVEEHEADIAAFLEELPEEKATIVFRTLPKELASEVFAYLPAENQHHIINAITDREMSTIIENLFIDDAVDFLEEMPAYVVRRVLQNAKEDTRALINQFLNYPENSAGSIMTAEYIGLKKQLTVSQAFMYIRNVGLDKETVYTCYVTDKNRVLEGIVTVKTLLLSEPDALLVDIMDENVLSVNTMTDREEASLFFKKYDVLALPVVDNENRLTGIITVDDIIDIIEDEATEDFEKMAAMLPSEKEYLKTTVFELSRNRIVWLVVLMVSGMITGSILAGYEEAFAVFPILVSFIPMLTDTGGNAGSQSSTLIIRGMALGEITTKDFLKVFFREFRVSLIVGAALALINFARIAIQYGDVLVALTVALSVAFTVVIAKSIGGLLPIIAKRFKVDPAIMAAPLITTIVDALALVVYFSIAINLLKI